MNSTEGVLVHQCIGANVPFTVKYFTLQWVSVYTGAFYFYLLYNTASKLMNWWIILKCATGMTASRLHLTLAMRVMPGGQTGAGST